MLLDRARLVPLQPLSRGRLARFEGSLCLVGEDPTRVASAALIDVCRTHRGPGAELIEKVASMVQRAAGATLPAFVVVAQDGDALLVALHGPASVTVHQPAGPLQLDGSESTAWVTSRVLDAAALNAALVEGPPMAVPALVDLQRGVAVGDGFALLAEGVAPGDLGGNDGAVPLASQAPGPVSGVGDVKVLADAPGAEVPAAPLALSPEAIRRVLTSDPLVVAQPAHTEEPLAPAPLTAEPLAPAPAPSGPVAPPPQEDPVPPAPPVLQPDPVRPALAVLPAVPDSPRSPLDVPVGAHPASPTPAAERPGPAPLGFASLPGGAFKIVELRPPNPAPAAAPLPVAQPRTPNDSPEAPSGAVRVRGVNCGRGHFNDPRARFSAVCGLAMFQTSIVMQEGPRPPLGVLLLSNGESFPLNTNLVLGREPGVHPAVSSGEAVGLVPTSMGPSLSRLHAQVRLEGWDVVLIDEGSTNGTFVWDETRRQWNRLVAHQPYVLRPGDQLAFGALTATFETSLQQ